MRRRSSGCIRTLQRGAAASGGGGAVVFASTPATPRLEVCDRVAAIASGYLARRRRCGIGACDTDLYWPMPHRPGSVRWLSRKQPRPHIRGFRVCRMCGWILSVTERSAPWWCDFGRLYRSVLHRSWRRSGCRVSGFFHTYSVVARAAHAVEVTGILNSVVAVAGSANSSRSSAPKSVGPIGMADPWLAPDSDEVQHFVVARDADDVTASELPAPRVGMGSARDRYLDYSLLAAAAGGIIY